MQLIYITVLISILLGNPAATFGQSTDSNQDKLETQAIIFEPNIINKVKTEYSRLFKGQSYETKFKKLYRAVGCTTFTRGSICNKSVDDENMPYSGSYYPEYRQGFTPRQAGTNQHGALEKYDQAFHQSTGTSAARWEILYNRRKIDWYGHCNGFGAAASRHRAPEKDVTKNGVLFKTWDIKALLAEIYMSTNLLWLGGERCEIKTKYLRRRDPTILAPCETINPAVFHLTLLNFIGRQRLPMIFDESATEQVWNYPVASFGSRIEEETVSAQRAYQLMRRPYRGTYEFNRDPTIILRRITTTIRHGEALPSETQGSEPKLKENTYEYILELKPDASGDDFEIVGGEWINNSITNHPDFLWLSYGPKAPDGSFNQANPHVDYNEVLKLWAESVGLDNIPDHPYSAPRGEKEWGDFSGWYMAIDNQRSGSVIMKDRPAIVEIFRDRQTLATESLIGEVTVSIDFNGQTLKPEKLSGTSALQLEISPKRGLNRLTLKWEKNGSVVTEGFANFFGM